MHMTPMWTSFKMPKYWVAVTICCYESYALQYPPLPIHSPAAQLCILGVFGTRVQLAHKGVRHLAETGRFRLHSCPAPLKMAAMLAPPPLPRVEVSRSCNYAIAAIRHHSPNRVINEINLCMGCSHCSACSRNPLMNVRQYIEFKRCLN
jgi:hypothetical protein